MLQLTRGKLLTVEKILYYRRCYLGFILIHILCKGGVGLNLVGANHLFLLDMHWNPQLESQACDRIYRYVLLVVKETNCNNTRR